MSLSSFMPSMSTKATVQRCPMRRASLNCWIARVKKPRRLKQAGHVVAQRERLQLARQPVALLQAQGELPVALFEAAVEGSRRGWPWLPPGSRRRTAPARPCVKRRWSRFSTTFTRPMTSPLNASGAVRVARSPRRCMRARSLSSRTSLSAYSSDDRSLRDDGREVPALGQALDDAQAGVVAATALV